MYIKRNFKNVQKNEIITKYFKNETFIKEFVQIVLSRIEYLSSRLKKKSNNNGSLFRSVANLNPNDFGEFHVAHIKS